MPLKPYKKKAWTNDQILYYLWDRGLLLENRRSAEDALKEIGYFRLQVFMRHFQLPTGQFQSRTQFADVLAAYDFDRDLRRLTMSATEHIELGLRASLGSQLSNHFDDPHWYMAEEHYPKYEKFHDEVGKIVKECKKKSSLAINHYFATYDTPTLPPAWVVFQRLTFGALSIFYSSLKTDRRKIVARDWRQSESFLVSWLRSTSSLRNECAHHGRLWRGVLIVDTPLAHSSYPLDFQNLRTFYARACVLKLLLDALGRGAWWVGSLKTISSSAPKGVKMSDFGFPLGWETRPLWR